MNETLVDVLLVLADFATVGGIALILSVCFKILQESVVVVRTWNYQRSHRHIPYASDAEMARFIEFIGLSKELGMCTAYFRGYGRATFYTYPGTNLHGVYIVLDYGSGARDDVTRLLTTKQNASINKAFAIRREELKAIELEKALVTG